MTAFTLAPTPAWPPAAPVPATLSQCLLLALLLHLLLVLLLGNAPGGTARPGEGVWGAVNVTLRGVDSGSAPAAVPAPALEQAGPPGTAPRLRHGGAVREAPWPASPPMPGAAQLGDWAPTPVPRSEVRPDTAAERRLAPPANATLAPAPVPVPVPAPAPAPPEPTRSTSPPVPTTATGSAPVTAQSTAQSTAPAPAPAPVAAALPPPLPAAPPAESTAAAQTLQSPLSQRPSAAAAAEPLATNGLRPEAWRAGAGLVPLQPLPPAPVAAASPAPSLPVPELPPAPPAPLATPDLPRTEAVVPAPPAAAAPPAAPAVTPPATPPAAVPAAEAMPAVVPPTVVPPAARPPAPESLPTLHRADLPAVPAPQSPLVRQPPATQPPVLPSLQALPGGPLPAAAAAPAAGLVPGRPDAGPQVGHDVATAPSAPASAPPRLNLELPRQRGGELSRHSAPGVLQLLPRPPELPSKLARDIDKAAKEDCRQAYSGAGVLAVVPLLADSVRRDGCKW